MTIPSIDELNKIRKLVIIAMFSDDEFMDKFVLKGGNALNLIYGINNRASLDIDLSMEDKFPDDTLNNVEKKLQDALEKTFSAENYHVFDIKLSKKPLRVREEDQTFWGGYSLEFKIIGKKEYAHQTSVQALRRNALNVGKNSTKFKVDISKYEYCEGKQEIELDGYFIYAYTPMMIIYEKLRAICQQMPEYKEIVATSRKTRARDFFDIYSIVQSQSEIFEQLFLENNLTMLQKIFEIKKVPLEFLKQIKNQREFHSESFDAVKDTVDPSQKLESYDFYFDYTLKISERLTDLLDKKASID